MDIRTSLPEKIIRYIFALFSIWFLFARIYYFATCASSSSLIIIGIFVVIFGLACGFIFLWPKLKPIFDKLKNQIKKLSPVQMIIIIFVTSLVSKIAMMLILQIDSSRHEDIKMYWSFIQQLTDNGVIVENSDYASEYIYTVSYALFFLPITKIFGADSIQICSLYLIVLLTISSLLLFDTVKYNTNKNYAFVAIMLWNLIPVGMLQPLFLCHENSLIIIHSIVIWIVFKLIPKNKNKIAKILLFLLAMLLCSYAVTINKFGVISICAIIIVAFIELIVKNFQIKNIGKFVAIVLIAAISLVSINSITTSHLEKLIDKSAVETQTTENALLFGFGWPIYVGLNFDSSGTWNDDDYITYSKYKTFDVPDEAKEYQIKLIKDRLNEYAQKPIRIPIHLNNKMKFISKTFNPFSTNLGGKVSKFIVEGMHGYVTVAVQGFFAAINVAVAFVLSFSFNKNRKESSSLNDYLKLFMMGVCFVLLFVEVASKYTTILLFVYLIIATLGLKDFSANMDKLSSKLNNSKAHKRN